MTAAHDFMKDELKITEEEIQELGIVNVTCPRKQECDCIYVYFSDETAANYFYRVNANVGNDELKVIPFVPP